MKTIEQYEEEFVRRQNQSTCKKCNSSFIFKSDECWWDDHGYSYSTKLTRCPHCNSIVVVKNVEDYGFSKLNSDKRYF